MKLPLAALIAMTLAAPLLAQSARPPAGDATAGARQFIKCKACHTATQGGANSLGPNLFGISGARAATRPGFAYSPALKKAKITWTADQLDAYIARPNSLVPGSRMVFPGIADAAARRDLIAYLATLKKR
jgi:cytochrome c